jgi:hypothetical protein
MVCPRMSRGVAIVVAGAAFPGTAWASAASSPPRVVKLELRSRPPGLVLASAGRAVVTPWRANVAAGSRTTLRAPAVVRSRGITYRFERWSDEGGAQHTLVIPPTDAKVTAFYREDKAAGRAARATGSTWQVDLGAGRAVDTVLVGPWPASVPRYVVEASADGRAYVTVAAVRRTGPGVRRVPLVTRLARFVRVRAPEGGATGLPPRDVAVLGPEDPIGPPAPVPGVPPPPARPALAPAPVPAPGPTRDVQRIQGSEVAGWTTPLRSAGWLLGR